MTEPSPSDSAAERERVAERELIEGLRRGDERAFEQLYSEHADGVFHFVERMLRSAADAADVLQETFIAVFRRIETYRGDGTLKSWLFRIAYRFALRAKRRRPFTLDIGNEDEAPPPPVWDAPPAEHDFRAAVDLEIQRLPPRSRLVFVMHTVEGMTHGEIAATLEIDEGTSKSQLHYARSLLKKRLARFEHELA